MLSLLSFIVFVTGNSAFFLLFFYIYFFFFYNKIPWSDILPTNVPKINDGTQHWCQASLCSVSLSWSWPKLERGLRTSPFSTDSWKITSPSSTVTKMRTSPSSTDTKKRTSPYNRNSGVNFTSCPLTPVQRKGYILNFFFFFYTKKCPNCIKSLMQKWPCDSVNQSDQNSFYGDVNLYVYM